MLVALIVGACLTTPGPRLVKRLGSWKLTLGGWVTGLTFSADGTRLASRGEDRNLRV